MRTNVKMKSNECRTRGMPLCGLCAGVGAPRVAPRGALLARLPSMPEASTLHHEQQ